MKTLKLCLVSLAAASLGASSLQAVVKNTAFLQGSNLADGSTELTTATPTAIAWTESSSVDPNTFDHSFADAGKLVVKKAGDYLVAATMPVISISTSDNRPSQALEVYVNGEPAAGTIGSSGYIRNQPRNTNMQQETSNHAHALISGLNAGDVIEVRVHKTAQAALATGIQSASVLVELVEPSRTVFAALSDDGTNAANLNPSFDEDGEDPTELSWNSTRKDSGITHSNGSANISLSAGTYILYANVPMQSTVQRAAPGLEVLLNGSVVKGGTARQGYIRNASGHTVASVNWSGLIEVSGSQTLTLQTYRLAQTGEVLIQDGKNASVFLEKIEDGSGVHSTSAAEVDNPDAPENWNPADKTALAWDSASITDSATYNQGSNQVTVRQAGSYLLLYQDTLQSSAARPNPRITVEVNGVAVPGAETKSHYIRNSNGHNEASGSLVFLLEDLSANDVITVSTQREGQTGNVVIDEFQDVGAIFSLIKKETIDTSSIASAPRVSFFTGGIDGFDGRIQNFASSVNESSVQALLNGSVVSTDVSTTDGVTAFSYSFPSPPESLSEHSVDLSYDDSDGTNHKASFSFTINTLFNQIPAAFAASGVDTSKPGFVANITQVSTAQSGVQQIHNTTVAGANAQIAGELVDADGSGYLNESGPINANSWEISPVDVEGVINFDQDAGVLGNFNDNNGFLDDFIPGIPGIEDSTDGIAAEFLTFLELGEGFHTLGVNSDDGFQVTTGPSLKDQGNIVLGTFDGGRGAADSLFNVLVEETGIYPVRLVWFEGGGGANVEFFSVTEAGEKILINDRSNSNGIKAYRSGNNRPFISSVSPQGSQLVDTLEYVINDADVNVVEGSISLTINGTSVTPSVSKSGAATTVNYTNPDGFFPGGDHTAVLSYDESSDPVATRVFNHNFSVPNGQSIVLLDNPFAYWRLGETEGDKANNEVSGLHQGTYNGNPGLGAERLVVGDPSSAVLFDSTQSNWLAIANHNDINNLSGNAGWTEKTIEFWFKSRNLPNSDPAIPDATISQRQVIYEQGGATRGVNVYLEGTKAGDSPDEAELWFNILNRAETAWGGTIPFNEDQGLSPNDEAIAISTTVKKDTLYHVVLVFHGEREDGNFDGGVTGYINGEAFGETIGANLLRNHTDGIGIGRRNNEVSFHDYIVNANNGPDLFNSAEQFYFDGWLDEFALYNVALSAAQSKAHYEAGLSSVPAETTAPPVVEPPVVPPVLPPIVLPPIPGGGVAGGVNSIIRNADGTVSIAFSGSLSAGPSIDGPFLPVPGATSPFIVNPNSGSQFFLAR
jgi:hypothetical protein